MTLKFTAIKFCQRTFVQSISQHQSLWRKLLTEAAIFSGQDRLCWRSHLMQLLPSNDFFMARNTSPDQLLLEDNYFPAQVPFRRSFFFKIRNEEQLLFQRKNVFRSWYFLKTVTFLIVLRNHFHSIYSWKDIPLTSSQALTF